MLSDQTRYKLRPPESVTVYEIKRGIRGRPGVSHKLDAALESVLAELSWAGRKLARKRRTHGAAFSELQAAIGCVKRAQQLYEPTLFDWGLP